MQESRLDWKSPTARMLLGVVLTVVTYLTGFVFGPLAAYMGLDDMMARVISRSIFGLGFIVLLGGRSWLRFDWKAIRETWLFARPLVMINLVIAAFITLPVAVGFIEGSPISQDTLARVLYYTILCIFIGINEEAMFRGLMFGGLLAGLGHKEKGPLWAALISSLAFGFLHVVFDLDFNNPLGIVQGLLKTLETGMFGFVLSVSVLEHRNLGGAMSVHGFFDWILIVANAITGSELTATYVSTDPQEAISGIVVFIIFAALYTPRTIKAFQRLSSMPTPQYGPFVEEQSATLVNTAWREERLYQQQLHDDHVNANIGRMKDRAFLNNKYLTFFAVFAFYVLSINVFSILFMAITGGGVAYQVLTAITSIVICAGMIYWYQRQFEGEFDGMLSWSTTGLLLALPGLLLIICDVIEWNANTTFNNPFLTILLALESGLTEEVIFRAIPVSNWMRVSGEKKEILLSMLASSAMFGVVHAINLLAGAAVSYTLFQIVCTFCIGIAFSAVFLRTGSIWPTVIVHTLINVVGFLTTNLDLGVVTTELELDLQFWLVTGFSLILLVWGLYLIRPDKQDEIVALWKKKWHKA